MKHISQHLQNYCCRCYLLSLIVITLQLLQVQATLTFLSFDDESLTCADGSPFGIYVEDNPKTPLSQSQNHVLVLMGGGSCAGPDDCRKDYKERPFVFSSSYNPKTIEGNTVLSSDPTINPSMHNYTKWMIPYCSQDFFLGDAKKGQVGDFKHMGSQLLKEAFSRWSNQVFQARQEGFLAESLLDTVVVIGISAGAVGLMNHVDTVRFAVNQIGSKNLDLLLDAPSVVSDHKYVGKDFNEAMNYYVDVQDEFLLCSPNHPFSGLYDSVSELPCCLSTHCMMRHDIQGLASFVLHDDSPSMANQSTTLEKLLILDSAYDPVALLGGTTFLQTDASTATPLSSMGHSMAQENAQGAWRMMEGAGGNKVRAKETAAAAKALALQESPNGSLPLQKRVQWIVTSCITHSYLAPTVEFLWLACEHSNYSIANFDMVCNPDGHATQYTDPDRNLVIRIWRTFRLWNQVRFEGQSIHEIVREFVAEKALPGPTFDGQAINLRFECAGPNCLSRSQTRHNAQPSCQALIEIENTHVSIPVAFQATWLIFLGLLILASVVITHSGWFRSVTAGNESGSQNTPPTAGAKNTSQHASSFLSLQQIQVSTMKNQKTLLHGVDIKLHSRTITALLGRSGCGKTTLLKVLSQNHQPTLNIRMDQRGEEQLSSMTKAYLCQEDPVLAFGNLYPFQYLEITAKLYGADPNKMHELYGFTKELLSRGGQQRPTSEKQMLNPFMETSIRNLSGGQRRILSIAATFLCDPQLLLLDEPCSGLDTISSLQVMGALQSFTTLSNCAALVTFHQPSEEILSHFKKVFVMNAGRVVLDEDVVDPQRTAHLIDNHLLHSYESSQRAAIKENSNRNLLLSIADAASPGEASLRGMPVPRRSLLRRASSGDYGGSSRRLLIQPLVDITEAAEETERMESQCLDNSTATDKRRNQTPEPVETSPSWRRNFNFLRQVKPLAQRIHFQSGYELTEWLTIVVTFSVLAAVLLLDDGSHVQIVLGSAAMIAVPSFLFTHKVFAYNELWLSHRFEMDDKRISPLSFQIATSLFTFPGPLMSVLLAVAVAYVILGWSFGTFVVQYLFVGVYLLVVLQFGRVLCVLFSGNFGPVMKVYTTTLLINAVFSSAFIPSNSFPESLNFLFYVSATFWALSGAVLNIFNDADYGQDRHCFDFFSCVFSDGNVAGRVLGFSPLSNSYRALGVLTCVLACLVFTESLLLYVRCRGAGAIAVCYTKTSGSASKSDGFVSSSATSTDGHEQDKLHPEGGMNEMHNVDSEATFTCG